VFNGDTAYITQRIKFLSGLNTVVFSDCDCP